MRFVKFVYTKEWGYVDELHSDYTYQMLGLFLTDEVGRDASSYKRWALDPDGSGGSGNIIYSDKANGKILLSYVYESKVNRHTASSNDPLSAEDELAIPQADFIHIIEEWVKSQRRGFQEIWIKNENGIFWVERVK